MQMIRAINVLTLASLLILTGCFGLVDEEVAPPAEGQSPTTNAALNHPPSIDVFHYTQIGIVEYWSIDTLTNTTSVSGANVSLYHAAIDVDGDLTNMGWDLDLDGSRTKTNKSPSWNCPGNHFRYPPIQNTSVVLLYFVCSYSFFFFYVGGDRT